MLSVFQRMEPDFYKAQSKVAREELPDFLSISQIISARWHSYITAAATAVHTLAWVFFLKMGPGASAHQMLHLQSQKCNKWGAVVGLLLQGWGITWRHFLAGSGYIAFSASPKPWINNSLQFLPLEKVRDITAAVCYSLSASSGNLASMLSSVWEDISVLIFGRFPVLQLHMQQHL